MQLCVIFKTNLRSSTKVVFILNSIYFFILFIYRSNIIITIFIIVIVVIVSLLYIARILNLLMDLALYYCGMTVKLSLWNRMIVFFFVCFCFFFVFFFVLFCFVFCFCFVVVFFFFVLFLFLFFVLFCLCLFFESQQWCAFWQKIDMIWVFLFVCFVFLKWSIIQSISQYITKRKAYALWKRDGGLS